MRIHHRVANQPETKLLCWLRWGTARPPRIRHRDRHSPVAGTILERTHLPLAVWLAAIELTRYPITVRVLAERLGISVKAACYLRMRIEHGLRRGDPLVTGLREHQVRQRGTMALGDCYRWVSPLSSAATPSRKGKR